MGLFDQTMELFEKRHKQKVNNVIKEVDRDIRKFLDETPECFAINNSTYKNVALYEKEVLAIKRAFFSRDYAVAKLKKRSRKAAKAFEEAEKKLIRRASLRRKYREKGINFPEEEMEELKKLEMYPYPGDRSRLAKLELMERTFVEAEQVQHKPNLKQRELEAKETKQTTVQKEISSRQKNERAYER